MSKYQLPERAWNGMTVLDAYCCQGGASMGYYLAGFNVVGVDIDPQPRYPFQFFQGDAVAFILENGSDFDLIAASPPCQRYSKAQKLQGNEHPDLIAPTRKALLSTDRPYVIENVENAASELIDPLMLCGASFGLDTYRHRLFETGNGFTFTVPDHQTHTRRTTKMGRPRKPGEMAHYVGHFSGADDARRDLNVPWMTKDGIRESIPPVYTTWIGRQATVLLNH